jgi:hypothetical protein
MSEVLNILHIHLHTYRTYASTEMRCWSGAASTALPVPHALELPTPYVSAVSIVIRESFFVSSRPIVSRLVHANFCEALR